MNALQHGRNTGLTAKQVRKLMRLPVNDEAVFDGVVWTRHEFYNPDDRRDDQYKVSPHGLTGDFDKDAHWVYRSEVAEDNKAFKAAAEAA